MSCCILTLMGVLVPSLESTDSMILLSKTKIGDVW